MNDITYYLFGKSACQIFEQEGIDGLIESGETYGVFRFVEGVTSSMEFANAIIGWDDYLHIREETFNRLVDNTKEVILGIIKVHMINIFKKGCIPIPSNATEIAEFVYTFGRENYDGEYSASIIQKGIAKFLERK